MSEQDAVERALRYGLRRYQQGSTGKTLLVGWRDGQPLEAVAAGLATSSDRERFAVLSRYLLRRNRADAYWLLFAADLGEVESLVAELAEPAQRRLMAAPLRRDTQGACRDLGSIHELGYEPPLGDLLDGGANLPAVMRRDLDRLALSLRISMPD